MLPPLELQAIILKRVTMEPGPDGCWRWTGTLDADGYGRVRILGKSYRAHRVAWEALHGPLAASQYVLHTCHVRRCVRPDHLYLGAQRENGRDTAARYARGEIGGPQGRQLTAAQVLDVRKRAAAGEKHVALAAELGVTRATIGNVVHRRTWRTVQ